MRPVAIGRGLPCDGGLGAAYIAGKERGHLARAAFHIARAAAVWVNFSRVMRRAFSARARRSSSCVR